MAGANGPGGAGFKPGCPRFGARVKRTHWSGDDCCAASEVLSDDGERILSRVRRNGTERWLESVLVWYLPPQSIPTPAVLQRLAHEYELKDDLENAWAALLFAFERENGDTLLVLEDPGGEPLDRLIGPPMEIGRFLRIGISLAVALGRLHERGSSTRTSSRPMSSSTPVPARSG